VRRAGRGGRQVVQHEVAVGDRVDRVGRHPLEAQLGGHGGAVGVEVHAGERARAERQRRRLGLREREALAVAQQHPDIREQVV
jgi:hypothetical protein